jgi:hypothetical protein
MREGTVCILGCVECIRPVWCQQWVKLIAWGAGAVTAPKNHMHRMIA